MERNGYVPGIPKAVNLHSRLSVYMLESQQSCGMLGVFQILKPPAYSGRQRNVVLQ